MKTYWVLEFFKLLLIICNLRYNIFILFIKKILIICFLLINCVSNAQDLQLTFSDKVFTSSEYKPLFCLLHEGSYLFFQNNKTSKFCNFKLNVFNGDLKNINQFDIEFEDETFLGVRSLFEK